MSRSVRFGFHGAEMSWCELLVRVVDGQGSGRGVGGV